MTDWVTALRRVPFVLPAARTVGRHLNHTLPSLVERERGSAPPGAGFDPRAATTAANLGPTAAGLGGLPLDPKPARGAVNPVVTAEDVTDFGAVDFVADPFMIPGTDRWHLFFEVCNYARDPDAAIGHATSRDGLTWEYDRTVLITGEHLSFPYVFQWEGDRYMIPEEGGEDGRAVRIYKSDPFPAEWAPCATPVSADHRTDDTVVFRHRDRWWLLVGDSDVEGFRLYHSDALEADSWTPHDRNPVVTGRPAASRPGGRPVVHDDGVLLFFQDCERQYGHRVRAYDVTELDSTAYTDREHPDSPVLEGTGSHVGWNAGRMHHLDPWYVDGRWFCAVDGNISHAAVFTGRHWSLGAYAADGVR
ncbi:hypothetical protein [Halorubrum sp. DTA46]|uniref:glucosamine inositolphosphorylceramide transferase family protein n=1 Tax=Halorubrum sp. DTA46 TaxID=3402162 RepID=UPI003AADE786